MFAQPPKYLLTIRCFFSEASVGASKKLASAIPVESNSWLIIARKQALALFFRSRGAHTGTTYANRLNSTHPSLKCPKGNTSIGPVPAGHWIKTAGILSPLVIGELAKDADKRWRWIRISAVAMALVSEGLKAHRVSQRRQEQEEGCR